MARKITSASTRFHTQAVKPSVAESQPETARPVDVSSVSAATGKDSAAASETQNRKVLSQPTVKTRVAEAAAPQRRQSSAGFAGTARPSQEVDNIVERAISSRTVLTPGVTRGRESGSSLQRSGAPSRFEGVASTEKPTASLASVPAFYRTRPDEFVYRYGLFAIQPEILALYDLDSLYTPAGEVKEQVEYLSIQRAAAKITQSAGYRVARQTLSAQSFRQEEPFYEASLKPLVPSGDFESTNRTMFEQIVASWDRDADLALQEIEMNSARATRMQNLVSLLDISNLPLTKSGQYLGLCDVLYAASESTSFASFSRPIATGRTTVARHSLRSFSSVAVDTAVQGVFDLMGLRSSDMPEIAEARRLDGAFASYSLIYWLLQNAHACFVYGSKSGFSFSSSVYAGQVGSKVRAFSLVDNPTAKALKNEAFASAEKFVDDMQDARSGGSAAENAAVLLHSLTGVAVLRSSNIDSSDSLSLEEAIEAKLGTSLFTTRSGSAARSQPTHTLEAAARADAGSCIDSIFNIPTSQGKAVFFDRHASGGLPDGFVSGYPRLFGAAGDARSVAEDLSARATRSLSAIQEVQRGVPLSDVTMGGTWGARKPADIPVAILSEIASLLSIDYDSSQIVNDRGGQIVSNSQSNETIRSVYQNFIAVAGTNAVSQLGASLGDLETLGDGVGSTSKAFGIAAGIDLPIFMTMSESYGTTLRRRVKTMISVLMRYWSQSFDYKTGARETPPDAITGLIYGDTPQEVHDTYTQLQRHYKRTYTRTGGDDATYQNFVGIHFELHTAGPRVIDSIVDWCIRTAEILMPGITSSSEAIMPVAKGAPHTLKSVCLNIFALACFTLDACFTRDYRTATSWDEDATGRAVLIFKPERYAQETLSSLVSGVAASYCDGLLSLETVNAQISKVVSLLADFSLPESDSLPTTLSPLKGGVFNQCCTPVQSFASRLRYSAYLSRGASAPYHAARYDEANTSSVKRAAASRALLSHAYFQDDNVKVLVVGLPAGLTHIVGQEETYVKIVVRRSSKDAGASPIEITRYFDVNTFFSPARAQEKGLAPFDVNATTREVTVPLLHAKTGEHVLHTTQFASFNDEITPLGAAGDVRVADYTVTCTFLTLSGLGKDLNVPSIAAIDYSRLRDNHVADVLLKEHIREVSGLDLDESVFTTSVSAFNPRVPDNMDTLRVKAYEAVASQAISVERAKNPQTLSADLRMLDVFSRTPLIRSNVYGDLCVNPTIFDRVFAIPIRVWDV